MSKNTFGISSYYVDRQESSLDAGIRKTLNGEKQTTYDSAEDFLQNAPLEEVRKAANKLAQSDQQKADLERSYADAAAFLKLHPEIKDTKANARLIVAHCKIAFGTTTPNLEQFAQVGESLAAAGELEFNQAELARQADAAATSRANTFRAHAFNAEEAENLPLEEIKRRAQIGSW